MSKKYNQTKTIPSMTLTDRVTSLERQFKNLQEYVIDLIEKQSKPEVLN